MRVIVLGAGVIGTTSAYYLAQAGAQVTVVDRILFQFAQEAQFCSSTGIWMVGADSFLGLCRQQTSFSLRMIWDSKSSIIIRIARVNWMQKNRLFEPQFSIQEKFHQSSLEDHYWIMYLASGLIEQV